MTVLLILLREADLAAHPIVPVVKSGHLVFSIALRSAVAFVFELTDNLTGW
jgi:hypothetical protein